MNDRKPPDPNYHVLLIGIDAYSVKPLYGCVNDIDVIQRLLLDERVAIPKGSVRRLVSPHPKSTHEATVASQPATLANICTALELLGSNNVKQGDRVFIYYSGHGTRVPVSTAAGTMYREALVPVDFNAQPGTFQLLFDFDVNRLLAAIVARTSAVTFILDCCNSAGATRELPASGMTSRFMDFDRGKPLTIAAEKQALAAAGVRGLAGNVDDCHVVTACLNHELAQESTGSDGVRHGLLTRALEAQLRAVPEPNLREVPWGRIWPAVRASVETANSMQHVWMAGNVARAVIAGPPVDGDMGLTVKRTGLNAYAIEAGTLAGITKGGKLAIYKGLPPRFPPLGSDQDRQARVSDVILEVTQAAPASATAIATGTPFDLPPGARGRLIGAGQPARLRCAVVPKDDAIAATLAGSALLELADEAHAEALLRKESDGTWALVDNIHGAKPDFPVLCRMRTDQLDLAARVMEQYFYYALPLRMAASCKDLSGALKVSLLRCPSDRPLTADEQDGTGLPEVGSEGAFTYDVRAGDEVAIRVRNTSNERLRVTLLNAAASGKVEYLGDQIIDGKALYVFWAANTRGKAFPVSTPKGSDQGIDRMVALGTTAVDKDLRYLQLNSKFADIIERTRGAADRDLSDDRASNPPLEQWTATEAVIRCRT
jgi:hypothetical protein